MVFAGSCISLRDSRWGGQHRQHLCEAELDFLSEVRLHLVEFWDQLGHSFFQRVGREGVAMAPNVVTGVEDDALDLKVPGKAAVVVRFLELAHELADEVAA